MTQSMQSTQLIRSVAKATAPLVTTDPTLLETIKSEVAGGHPDGRERVQASLSKLITAETTQTPKP